VVEQALALFIESKDKEDAHGEQGKYAGTAMPHGARVAWTTRDSTVRTEPAGTGADVVSTGPSRLKPRGSPTTRYDETMQTPEPPGGQVQTKLKPLRSAVKRGEQTPAAVYDSHENEWDRGAG
jgi:hypothetical protein